MMAHLGPSLPARGTGFQPVLPLPPRVTNPCHANGFTLVEVMISIVLSLILIIGINLAFKVTSQTVGAAQALSSVMRDARAAESIFQSDLGHAIVINNDEPFLIITSQVQSAFRNRADEQTDRDADPLTQDLDNSNVEGDAPGERTAAATYNQRNHRIDTLSFFARDLYRRQTGNDTVGPPGGSAWLWAQPYTDAAGPHNAAPASFAADMAAKEAWISYGHLWMPDNTPVFAPSPGIGVPPPTYPGQSSAAANPNNFYASDWALGRVAILLSPPHYVILSNGAVQASLPLDRNGALLTAIDTPPTATAANWPALSPSWRLDDWPPVIAAGAYASVDNATIETSRYDLALGTITGLKTGLTSWLSSYPTVPWWTLGAPAGVVYRFQCNPKAAKPLTPAGAAHTFPYFLGHCTQFIVEYAGDYLKQDNRLFVGGAPNLNYGNVINVYTSDQDGTDGELDYWVDKSADPNWNNATTANPNLWFRRTRWYGMPRDTGGWSGNIGLSNSSPDGHIYGWRPISSQSNTQGHSVIAGDLTNNDLPDVLPLRDVMRTCFGTTPAVSDEAIAPKDASGNDVGYGAPFERFFPVPVAPTLATNLLPLRNDYAFQPEDAPNGFDPTKSMTRTNRYICAWGPGDRRDLIKLVRIIVTLDEPNGRLADGQTFQYVIKLQ
jgi:prepilin-type N-terminal cleavage/methylation domain-containing protein